MKQQIPGYDLLKFIMALFVVGIHANLANAINVYNPYIGGSDWRPARVKCPGVLRD